MSIETQRIAHELEQDEQLHEWEPERLIKAFAYKVYPRWFNAVNLHDIFHVASLDTHAWEAPLKALQESKFLIFQSPEDYFYHSIDGTRYQINGCYRIERGALAAYKKEIAAFHPDPPPAQPTQNEILLPSIVENTRGYIQAVTIQANGCYEQRWFDACSVMVRKLVEMLIIAVYEHEQRPSHIQGPDQNFVMLGAMIDRFIADPAFSLGRETKNGLPLIKELGDRSAHNRHFVAKKADVDRIIPPLRVIVPELLHLAGLKT